MSYIMTSKNGDNVVVLIYDVLLDIPNFSGFEPKIRLNI